MILLSLLFAIASLGALGLSQPQHYGWAMSRAPSPQRRKILQTAGWGLLAPSLACALTAWEPARGWIGAFGVLTLAAAILVLFRTYAPLHRGR